MKPSLALDQHRLAIKQIVQAHRARNPRVFGSVLDGLDVDGSDLDILVDPLPGMTLFDIGAMRHKLGTLLKVPVDILTPNALPEKFRHTVVARAMAI